MITINRRIAINDSELQEEFIHASGPGGQNVNKVATAVKLRFNVAQSPSLPESVRKRLLKTAGKRINAEGELVIDARQFRTQARNRQSAVHKLILLIRKAAQKPKKRIPTKPTAASKEKRLTAKRQRSEIKKLRQPARGE